ncbi:hypothetical protein D3C87_1268700 [compost metagenome]
MPIKRLGDAATCARTARGINEVKNGIAIYPTAVLMNMRRFIASKATASTFDELILFRLFIVFPRCLLVHSSLFKTCING